jgi:hypothetical protein
MRTMGVVSCARGAGAVHAKMECGVQYCLLQAWLDVMIHAACRLTSSNAIHRKYFEEKGRTTSIYRGRPAEPGEEPVPGGTRPEIETEGTFELA